MPDIWTTNPLKLRTALSRLGAQCGTEPRVLKPREKEWTCQINFPDVGYDLYLHHVLELSRFSIFYSPLIIATVSGLFVGLLWGKRFWRTPPSRPPQQRPR